MEPWSSADPIRKREIAGDQIATSLSFYFIFLISVQHA